MSEFVIPPVRFQETVVVKKRSMSKLVILLAAFAMAVSFAFAVVSVRTIVRYQAFRSSGASMEPALMAGDHFYLDRGAYAGQTPRRGDIVATRVPRGGSVLFVKRVIGLPGDRVAFKNGMAIVNGKPVTLSKLGDAAAIGINPSQLNEPGLLFYTETFEDGTSFRVAYNPKARPVNVSETLVPAGDYYVVGDNRDYSTDSRFYGTLPGKYFAGRVALVWANFNPGSFWIGARSPK
jgi:signal peptidase I